MQARQVLRRAIIELRRSASLAQAASFGEVDGDRSVGAIPLVNETTLVTRRAFGEHGDLAGKNERLQIGEQIR